MAEGEQSLLLSFDADDVAFRVDHSKREISGLLLPWGVTGNNGIASWRFVRGSVKWNRGQVGRVKLLRDHDMSRPVGVATSLVDRPDGLHVTAKVASGQAGDEVLSLAQEGVLDGFSAGLRIEPGGWEISRGDEPVRDVSNATLKEATVTAIPAFDDARVTRVNANLEITQVSDERGTPVTGEQHEDKGSATTGGTDPKQSMEAFETALNERFDSVAEKMAEVSKAAAEGITESVKSAMENVFSAMEDSESGHRAQMAAARLKVTKEEPVYRFDGTRTSSLVRDFWRAQTENDRDAVERLRKFQEQQRDMVELLNKVPPGVRQTFGVHGNFVDSTSAADIIPPGYRPDLFVNELRQGRPIVAQSSRGTITDATPFTVPVFVSSSGATGDHTENVNPTPGTLTLDQATVSPGAVSGSFELSREIVDAANPAIDAIALSAMREDYNQRTEAKAYAELNGAAAAGNTEATVGDNTDITNTRSLLSRYSFNRFAAPTGAVMNQAVTTTFATANGTDGRPLLPSVGAENSAGLGNAVNQGWFIDGLPFVPAWAITDNASDDVAIILNRMDWWTWESPLLTFRFEEKQGPAKIELALFAYYGTKVLRPAGIFALRNAA